MISITIDPNVRVRGNHTLAGFGDADDVPSVGEVVQVREAESGAVGVGVISGINAEKQLIYIAVDWPSLRIGGVEDELADIDRRLAEGWVPESRPVAEVVADLRAQFPAPG